MMVFLSINHFIYCLFIIILTPPFLGCIFRTPIEDVNVGVLTMEFKRSTLGAPVDNCSAVGLSPDNDDAGEGLKETSI